MLIDSHVREAGWLLGWILWVIALFPALWWDCGSLIALL